MDLRVIFRRVRKDQTDLIRNKIAAGEPVFFENPSQEIAFKYVPGEIGEIGKYYAKYFGREEFEICFDSSPVLIGIMKGKLISRSRYHKYHTIGKSSKNKIGNEIPVINQEIVNQYADCVY